MKTQSVIRLSRYLFSRVLLAGACDSLQLSADLGSCSTGAQAKGPLHSVQAPLSRYNQLMHLSSKAVYKNYMSIISGYFKVVIVRFYFKIGFG